MLRVCSGTTENSPLVESAVESLRLSIRLGYIANSNEFSRLGGRCD